MTPPTRLTTADLPGRTTNGLASGATGGSFHHPRRRRQHRDYHTVAKVDFVHVGTVKHAPPPRHRCCSILDRLQVGPGELLLRVTRSGCCSSHPTKSPATLGCLPSRLWGARTGSISTGLQFPESAGDLHAARSYSLISRAPWNRLAPLRRHDLCNGRPPRAGAVPHSGAAISGRRAWRCRRSRAPPPAAAHGCAARPAAATPHRQGPPAEPGRKPATDRRTEACLRLRRNLLTRRGHDPPAYGRSYRDGMGSRVISGRSWPDVEDGHGLIVKSVPDAVGTAAG